MRNLLVIYVLLSMQIRQTILTILMVIMIWLFPNSRPAIVPDIFITQVSRPTIGGKDSFVETFMDQVEPGGASAVKVGESALFLFGIAKTLRLQPAATHFDPKVARRGNDFDSWLANRLPARRPGQLFILVVQFPNCSTHLNQLHRNHFL